MPVQIVGNQPTGVVPYQPRPETTNNPRVFTRLNEPSARNWDSLGRPTNLPQLRQSTPQPNLPRWLTSQTAVPADQSRVQPRSPGSLPEQSAAARSPASAPNSFARGSFNPADYARQTPAPTAIPGGAPTTAGATSPTPGAAPSARLPSGAASIGLGILFALPTELPRLAALASNPGQYWGDELTRQRAENPELYDLFGSPSAAARTGLEAAALRSPVAPFTGGQSPGVPYGLIVRIKYGAPQPGSGLQPRADSVYRTSAPGPIGNIAVVQSTSSSPLWVGQFNSGSGLKDTGTGGFVSSYGQPTITFDSVFREDGQPDTGGNPPPEPGASVRPALASPTRVFNFPAASQSPAAAPTTPNSTIAPTVTPEQLRRVTPDPLPGVPDATPTPATSPDNGLIPLGLGLAAAAAAGLGFNNWNQNRNPSSASSAPPTPVTPELPPTPGICRFRDDPHSPAIDARTQEMQRIELAIQAYQTAMLTKLDEKLGPQLPNGGVSGKLGRMGALASKTWNFLQVDRALNVLTWIGVLHNAYMLSNNLAQTLFSAIGNVLDAVGIQKVDAEGNEEPYDIQEIVAKYTDNFGKSVFGVEEWKGIKAEWKAVNRIYQAASNILSSLQSITFSMVEMLEQIANYTGRIGNSLRRSGTILQNSFNWMNPNANFTNNRFFNALNNTSEAVEAVDSIASEVLSIQQTARDLADQKSEFEKAASDAVKLVNDAETKAETDSKKPNVAITPSDEKKAD